jgi:Fe-Mn family superoxide dismutase
VQGSGWAWLVYDSSSGHVRIVTRPNQDPVSTNANEIPLLGVDVWEHAYYLQYQNVRANYVKVCVILCNVCLFVCLVLFIGGGGDH